ncbi:MAG: DUF58 domain-containing protein [Micrococcales bacterium]|nr:DUF58 domain-containing protein [Micrococcales bacterium]MCL2667128.1 DUF58 domain-containing protein [Micrococcales bacterium]
MRIKVSPLGWGVAAVGVAAAFAGRRFAWVELAAIGVGCLLLMLAGVLMAWGRSRYQVRLELAERRVPVGQPVVARLETTAERRSLPARVDLQVGSAPVSVWLPSLAAGATYAELFPLPTDHRAAIPVGPVSIRRGDPLGLVSREQQYADVLELLVHPRVLSLADVRPGLLRDLEGQSTRDLSDADLSFHALREYSPGDDRRMIHWRTSARTGTLMVRQFEDTRRTRTTIALATHEDDYADPEEFEMAVSVAASLALHVLRDERELTFLAGPRRFGAVIPSSLLDECARVDTADDGTRTADLPYRVAAEPATSSVAFLVGGSTTTADQRRSSVRHVPTGLRVVAVACALDAPVEVRQDGMASLTQIGALDDLPRLMHRVLL